MHHIEQTTVFKKLLRKAVKGGKAATRAANIVAPTCVPSTAQQLQQQLQTAAARDGAVQCPSSDDDEHQSVPLLEQVHARLSQPTDSCCCCAQASDDDDDDMEPQLLPIDAFDSVDGGSFMPLSSSSSSATEEHCMCSGEDNHAVLTSDSLEEASRSPSQVRRFRHNPYSFVSCTELISASCDHATTEAPIASPTKASLKKKNESMLKALRHRKPMFQEASPSIVIPSTTEVVHEPKMKTMCCYFKQNGTCKMGDKCWYGHEGDLYTPCHYGAGCKAGHATLALMAEMKEGRGFAQCPFIPLAMPLY